MMRKALYILAFIYILFGTVELGYATTYYVDRNHPAADDANPGTESLPWATIGHAEDVAVSPGDVVYVKAGIYDERVVVQHSGSEAGGFITFAGYPGDPKPIVRGFSIYSQHYIRIVGFEITHNSLAHSRGFTPTGTCSHIEILDNYIHHTYLQGVHWYNQDNSYITIRGNEIYMTGSPSGVVGGSTGAYGINGRGIGSHILIEYNHIHRSGDFIDMKESYVIVRNNYLHDFQNAYWPDGSGDGLHCDMFQPADSGTTFLTKYHVYESNFMGDNVELNSHILQMRTQQVEEDHVLFRGNVGYNHGSYAMQCGGLDYVYFYNNTIHNMNMVTESSTALRYNDEGSNYSLYNQNLNNIYSMIGLGLSSRNLIGVDAGNTVSASNNLGYLSGSDASVVSTENPKFVDSGQDDFHLQVGSPAIQAGRALTTVSSTTGSGTSFEVEDVNYFCDGYGLTDGDLIKVGSNDPVRIDQISGNTVTVASSFSWNTGDEIYWRNQDTNPDIGAYEYRADGYAYGITIDNPLVVGGSTDSLSFTATPENPDSIRFVMYYINGLPAATVYEPPYSYDWSTTGLATGSSHRIEVRAYALYADKVLWQSDGAILTIGDSNHTWVPFSNIFSDGFESGNESAWSGSS